jgi:hypothetical protein
MYVIARPANGIDVNATLGRNSVYYNEFEIAIPERVLPSDIRAVTPVNADGSFVGYSTLNPGFKPR